MIQIRYTTDFMDWLNGLNDAMTRTRLNKRLEKVQRGILGDVKPVGSGLWEMREHFGAGYRMYYIQRGQEIILMVGGGDKSSQRQDIQKAHDFIKTLEE